MEKRKCVVLSAFILLVISVVFVTAVVVDKGEKLKLIIDNDAGGDDAMAIFIALQYEKYFDGPEVIALTTVNGNTNEENVCHNNQRILKVANRQDIPIYRGAASSLVVTPTYKVGYFGIDGLGDNNLTEADTHLKPPSMKNAAEKMVQLSKEHEGKLVLVTLGGLTNIALALKLDSSFLDRLAHAYIGAGRIYENDPTQEFNTNMDVEAYKIVVNHANPEKVTMIQNKTSFSFTKEWRTEVLGSINTNIMKAQNMYERVYLKRVPIWSALDPAVMAIALKPDLVDEAIYSKNDIIISGPRRGSNTNEIVENKKDANIKIINSIKTDEYEKFLIDVFSSNEKK